MATTAYKDTGAILSISGFTFGIDGAVNYDSVTRSNNTVTVNGANGLYKITGNGSSFNGVNVSGTYQFETGTTRTTQSFGSGSFSNGQVLTGTETNFTVSVGANDTTVSVRAGARYGADGYTYTSSSSMDIPSLGSPTIDSHSVTGITATGATINWTSSNGSNGTFSSLKLDYGLTTSYGTIVSGLSADSSTTLSGLIPGATYHGKLTITNGGGKTGNSGDFTFQVLPAPNTSAPLLSIIGVL